jgi:anti-sigma regulatory factor (Ser/Thr protein kinase)
VWKSDVLARQSATAYEHVALVHDGPGELAQRMAAPLRARLEAGDAVFVCLAAPAWEALAAHIGPAARRATVAHQDARYASPGTAMAGLHRFVGDALEAGAEAAWSIGTLPLEGTPDDARWWRYESAVDEVLGDRPLHAICTFDWAVMTAEQLRCAHRTHAWIDAAGGRHASEAYGEAWEGQDGLPLSAPPTVELEGDDVSLVRRTVAAACGAAVSRSRLDDLTLLVSELVTNGIRHGLPPVVFRAWDLPGEVVVEVSDAGVGVGDVYADLRAPRGGAHGQFGLWLVGQLAHRLTIGRRGDRTVVTAALRR